jgi:hypothetical protein
MNIQFYTHACFSVENEDAILLNDPYLNGTAFNDGWDLIEDNVVFDRFTEKKLFIYYSHEHPDHFSIPFLKSINKEIRNEITIIFQKTRDKRVKSFLENQGFAVLELDDRAKAKISNDFFITIGQVPFYDSWAFISSGLYHLLPGIFEGFDPGSSFSLEEEIFPNLVSKNMLGVVKLDTSFIDIGIPEDYLKFCKWIDSEKNNDL